MAIRTPFAPHHLIMFPWGGVTTPRRPITHGTSCDVFVGGGVPDAPPTTHRTPAKSLSLRTSAHTGVAIRNLPHVAPLPNGETDSHVTALLGMTFL